MGVLRYLPRAAAGLVLLFLIAPLAVLVVSSFNSTASLAFPPSGFSFRWYREVLSSSDWLVSFQLSGLLAVLVVITTIAIATPAAYALTRRPRRLITGLALAPLLVPEIIIALGLLYYLQGLHLINTITGLWLAHSLIALPYALRAIMVSASGLDPALERAAASLGASRLRTFWTVTLPLMRPGVVAGAVFAAVTSLGEVAVTQLISGANTVTVPVRIFSAVQFQLDPSVAAVSTLLMAVSVIVLLVLDRFAGISDVVA